MANDRAWEASQLLELLQSVRDRSGRLVVLEKISSRRHLTIALRFNIGRGPISVAIVSLQSPGLSSAGTGHNLANDTDNGQE